jgi:ribosomal protein L11 methyltransferase
MGMTAMPPDLEQSTTIARLAADEATAHRIIDLVTESYDPLAAVAGVSEDGPGRWAVAIHFRDPPNETAVRALVALSAGPDAANKLWFETTTPKDWVKASHEGLKPIEAGRFVVHTPHYRGHAPLNRIAIEIEASLAFGTGHHGTTRGCLLALDRIVKSRRPPWQRSLSRLSRTDPARRGTILDIGTGTGVLAIAAARALHCRVVASDIDPVAVRVARANVRLNRAGGMVELMSADGLGVRRLTGRHDLILANILLAPLQRLATPISRNLAPGGRVVLSGLLRGQAVAALAPYIARGLILKERIPLEGWMTLVLKRKAARHRAVGHKAPGKRAHRHMARGGVAAWASA